MTADVALFSILAYLLFSSAHKNFFTLLVIVVMIDGSEKQYRNLVSKRPIHRLEWNV